jgi:predicted Zn-dependent protease
MFKRSVISMLMIALVYASVPAMAATKPATLAHKLNQVKALYLIGQTVAAFQEANQLVLAHPKNAKAWYVAAEAQAWQGHWKQANLDLREAITLYPAGKVVTKAQRQSLEKTIGSESAQDKKFGNFFLWGTFGTFASALLFALIMCI